MPLPTDPNAPSSEPPLTEEQKILIFTEMLNRARQSRGDNPFARRCTASVGSAVQAAQEVADDLGLGVKVPARDILYFLPENKSENCHIFSLKPREGVQRPAGEDFDINDFLLCCYPQYDTRSRTIGLVKNEDDGGR